MNDSIEKSKNNLLNDENQIEFLIEKFEKFNYNLETMQMNLKYLRKRLDFFPSDSENLKVHESLQNLNKNIIFNLQELSRIKNEWNIRIENESTNYDFYEKLEHQISILSDVFKTNINLLQILDSNSVNNFIN